MSIINANPLLAAAGGDYQISRSVRLRSSASAYFNRTPASAGNRKTWTWSGWVKRGGFGYMTLLDGGSTGPLCDLQFSTTDNIRLYVTDSGITTSEIPITNAVFRDPSAWYHIVCAVDTTQATVANRVKFYVNGVQQAITGLTGTVITQNSDLGMNRAITSYLGVYSNGTTAYLDGYLTEVNFIDGQALTPSSFGETDAVTGVWKPKKYGGTYGTNGFYLNFSDNSAATAAAIGKDYSGNGNNWTPNNISVTAGSTYDSMLDVPTPYADGGNGRGNYAVLNPLDGAQYSGVRNTLTNGNLTATFNVAGSSNSVSSFVMPTGRWYCEFTVGARTSPIWFGAQDQAGFTGNGSAYNSSGEIYCNGALQGTYATFTAGDIIGCAYDITNNQVSFYKNGIQQGTTGTLGVTTKTYNVWVQINATNDFINANFGQRPFAYTPPTGFKALNTQNLPDSTIKKGNQYFDAALYSGGAGDVSVTGLGFTPDFTWLKARSIGFDHGLYDSVRGATKELMSQSTAAETTQATGLKSFDASGFTVGGRFSGAGNTYASWNWKESASAGFDIVTFTNPSSGSSSFAHNLGVKPSMIIVKSRSNTSNWTTMHKSLGTNMADNWINLESTAAKQTSTNIWGGEPTSSVFYCGTGIQVANATMVAYLFAEVAGFSKFGSYTGNGSADGPFVYCGFRPAFIMAKDASATNSWVMYDLRRDPYNVSQNYLIPNSSGAEGVSTSLDITANGFKIRTTGPGALNTNGSTVIFAAFAENPFKLSLAR